jgi:hypothetical protein
MASKHFRITGGPSLLDINLSVVDYKHPRLLLFKLEEIDVSRRGEAEVHITGIVQERVGEHFEEWQLTGWFMCEGLETKVRDLMHFDAFYDTGDRTGIIYTDLRTLSPGTLEHQKTVMSTIIRWRQ